MILKIVKDLMLWLILVVILFVFFSWCKTNDLALCRAINIPGVNIDSNNFIYFILPLMIFYLIVAGGLFFRHRKNNEN